MNILRVISVLFIVVISHIQAQLAEDKNPIFIQLSNKIELSPIYLPAMQTMDSEFSASYIASLEKILRFDLAHNGMTYLSKSSAEKERLAACQENCDFAAWSHQQVDFVVSIKVKNQDLRVHLIEVNQATVKILEGFQLSGNFAQDRRLMHRISDLIYKTLFKEEGIASTRFLYTVKTRDAVTKKWISEIFEADYDGGNARQVTHKGNYCITPSYIPPRPGYSSRSFLFVSYEIGQPKIYLGNLDNSSIIQRLSLLKGNQLMPTLSRQRDKLAFICDVTGNPDLFLQDFDTDKGPQGKPRQIYATHKATQGTPSFHPNGRKIAFVSNKDGAPRIYVMAIPRPGAKLNEIKAQLLTKINKENTAPNWSPDGQKIAYCALTKGVRQIWVYDFNTNVERQLTQGPGNKENPTWAPNSLHLIFNSSDAEKSELYLINLNQPEAIQISQGPGEKHFPSWEPLYKSF